MKRKIVIVVLILVFALTGCSKSQVKLPGPNEVVENYFKYYNEKNREEVLSTLTEWHNAPNVIFQFENLDNIRLIDNSKSYININLI